jgi:hypothetical protein
MNDDKDFAELRRQVEAAGREAADGGGADSLRHIADAERQVAQRAGPKAQNRTDARLAKLETTARLLSQTLSQLAGTVGRLADQRPSPTGGATPQAEPASHDELVAWVGWLVDHHELRAMPECWARHAGLVDELDALRIAYLTTIGNDAGGFAQLQWHEHLARLMQRVDDRRYCIAGHDNDRRPWSGHAQTDLPHIDLDASRYRPGTPDPTATTPSP